jgi:hypothetical protein
MLTIHITEDDPTDLATADQSTKEGLAACLAHYGVPHDVIHTALASLAQVKTLILCKPSEYEAWEIQASAA